MFSASCIPPRSSLSVSPDELDRFTELLEQDSKIVPLCFGRMRVPAVFCDSPADTLDSSRCLQASTQPTVKPAASRSASRDSTWYSDFRRGLHGDYSEPLMVGRELVVLYLYSAVVLRPD